jgi:hypothetical protein
MSLRVVLDRCRTSPGRFCLLNLVSRVARSAALSLASSFVTRSRSKPSAIVLSSATPDTPRLKSAGTSPERKCRVSVVVSDIDSSGVCMLSRSEKVVLEVVRLRGWGEAFSESGQRGSVWTAISRVSSRSELSESASETCRRRVGEAGMLLVVV